VASEHGKMSQDSHLPMDQSLSCCVLLLETAMFMASWMRTYVRAQK